MNLFWFPICSFARNKIFGWMFIILHTNDGRLIKMFTRRTQRIAYNIIVFIDKLFVRQICRMKHKKIYRENTYNPEKLLIKKIFTEPYGKNCQSQSYNCFINYFAQNKSNFSFVDKLTN